MEEKNPLDPFLKAANNLCASSREHGVDTRSALAGGALGLLLSSKGGRSLAGKLVKYGVIAGLGAFAWQVRQRDRDALSSRAEHGASSSLNATTSNAITQAPGSVSPTAPGTGPDSSSLG